MSCFRPVVLHVFYKGEHVMDTKDIQKKAAGDSPACMTSGPVTADMLTSDVLDRYPEVYEIFLKYGMLCMDCICADEETLEESCRVHCMDVDAVVDLINRSVVGSKEKPQS